MHIKYLSFCPDCVELFPPHSKHRVNRKFLILSPRDEVRTNPYSSSILATITNLINLRKAVAKENLISRSVTFHASYSTIVTRAAIALLINMEAQKPTRISLILRELVGFPRSNCSRFGKWSQDTEYPDRYLVRSAKLPYHLELLLD